MDQIAREVTEAQARVHARRNRIAVAQAGIQSARGSYDRNFSRIREGQGLPIEVLQAIQALDATQRELVDATVDFNVAQFGLAELVAASSFADDFSAGDLSKPTYQRAIKRRSRTLVVSPGYGLGLRTGRSSGTVR